jgi:DNA-binding response OmpR family regulator
VQQLTTFVAAACIQGSATAALICRELSMKRRILLVDDELAILLTLKAVLEIHGFDVETAASGKEAISKLKAASYHMVITDMKMEHEKAGYDVIRAAKKTDYNPAVAILTAYPLLGGDWKNEGAQSMLVKPMNTDDLLRQIEALLIQHEDNKQHKSSKSDAAKNGRSHAVKRPA